MADTQSTERLIAAEIAARLDGRRNGAAWMARCPAHDDNTPSLSLTERDGRVLVRCHAGCSQDAVIAALRERGLWPSPSGTCQRKRNDSKAAALRLWRQSQPAAGTIVDTYLRARGIELQAMPDALRFHAALRYDDSKQTLPGMVAAVRDVGGGVVAVHRTFLRPDGSDKADIESSKRMLGSVSGAAVRLTDAAEMLAVAEGIETALSVHVATHLPTWAALSAPGIAALQLPPLPLAGHVIIATDADDDGASMRAARKAADRWLSEGRHVRVANPLDGTDFADVLREFGVECVRGLLDEAVRLDAQQLGGSPPRVPVLLRMSDVQSERVGWLWYPRLPVGKVCFLDGDPGIGKGFLVSALVATITTAAHWPDGADCTGGDVVLLNAEDGAADTLRPRLDAAGADVSRVHLLTGYRDDTDAQRFVTLQDIDVLRETAERIGPIFVSVDPVQGYLGAKVDMHRANEVRPILAALAKLAEDYRCTILFTRHLTKGSRDRALYRGLGSIDFAAAARSVLLVGLDPNDGNRRALAHVKPTAWAPRAATLAFTIEDNRVLWSAERCELTAEMLTAPDQVGLQRHTKTADAIAFLETALAQGPRAFADLLADAEHAGLEKHHLIRASKKLSVISEGAGFPRSTTWRLAKTAHTATIVTTVTTDSTLSRNSSDRSSSSYTHRNTRARARDGDETIEVVEV